MKRRSRESKEAKNMKLFGFATGLALGMAAAAASVSAMYPDVPRRVKRDTKHIMRTAKKML